MTAGAKRDYHAGRAGVRTKQAGVHVAFHREPGYAERAMREYCQRRRDLIYAGLAGIAGLRPYLPDAGMFMLVDIRATGLSGAQFVRRLYDAERVSVLDGAVFGRATEGFVRLCFAVEDHEIDGACARIRRFCARLGDTPR